MMSFSFILVVSSLCSLKNILFNCSTNTIGGGVKNAAFFVKCTLNLSSFNFIYAISPQVLKLLSNWNAVPQNYFLFKKSPSRNLKERKRLLKISIKESIDIVYTMAGPSYVKFPCMHIMGLSNPYITHCNFQSLLRGISFFSTCKLFFLVLYQMYYSMGANVYIFQTYHSQLTYHKRFFFLGIKSHVVSNAFDQEFMICESSTNSFKPNSSIKVFCPGDDYRHKALDSIVYLSNFLSENFSGYNFTFYLTINKNSKNFYNVTKDLHHKFFKNIIFIGNISYPKIKKYYLLSNFVYVPSYLETFSATYLEAFSTSRPLIVNNSSFAIDICKDAAMYVNPYDYSTTSLNFIDLAQSPSNQSRLVKNGRALLQRYPNQEERFNKIFNIISNNIGHA